MVYLKKHHPNLSHAQACRLLGCSRSGSYYQKRMPQKDEPLRQAITSVLGTSRKGRDKVIALVRKRYPQYGQSQIRRVYEQGGFALTKRLRRRIKDNPANPIEIPVQENQEWAMDFMSDALADGRRIRTLNIIDHFNRKCLGVSAAFSIPASGVIRFLEQRIELHGKPERIRTDNGPEFRSKLFQKWLAKNTIAWSRIQKGKPQQNAIIERFNRTYREDVLDANLFPTLDSVTQLSLAWVEEYNNERPHQALGHKTPSDYAA